VRKKNKMADAIEFFSDARSHRTIRRADVVLHMFDTSQELSQLDKKLARYVVDHHKPVILCANKWDLVADMERQDFVDYIRGELPGVSFAPLRFLSAKTGQGVEAVLRLAEDLYERSRRRVGTGELNRVMQRATDGRSPTKQGASVRIYYATQTAEAPPTFTLFVNDKRLLGKSYLRFLQNRLREELELGDLPLRLLLRDKKEGDVE
jgi:GTP-binding protein